MEIFVRYLRESGIIDEVTRVLGGYVKRNRKGVPAREMIEQVMAYIAQDCKRTIEGFNAKKKDKGYLKLCGWKEHVPQGFVEDYADEDESWVCALARFYHGRGEDELTFRRMLEVWSENLPFLNYEANAVFFCFLALTLNALMLYWENVLRPLHGETLFAQESYTPRQRVVKPKRRRNRKVRRWIYVRTLQEMFFHIPGRIVHRGRSVILQVPDWLFRHLRLDEVFDRVCRAGPVFVT